MEPKEIGPKNVDFTPRTQKSSWKKFKDSLQSSSAHVDKNVVNKQLEIKKGKPTKKKEYDLPTKIKKFDELHGKPVYDETAEENFLKENFDISLFDINQILELYKEISKDEYKEISKDNHKGISDEDQLLRLMENDRHQNISKKLNDFVNTIIYNKNEMKNMNAPYLIKSKLYNILCKKVIDNYIEKNNAKAIFNCLYYYGGGHSADELFKGPDLSHNYPIDKFLENRNMEGLKNYLNLPEIQLRRSPLLMDAAAKINQDKIPLIELGFKNVDQVIEFFGKEVKFQEVNYLGLR